jgi:hypothetical protein
VPGTGDIDDGMADKRRRLGSALQQLARELAEARRRNRQLERELERLRAEKRVGAARDARSTTSSRSSRTL